RTSDRLATARSAAHLVSTLRHLNGIPLVQQFASLVEPSQRNVVSTSRASAPEVATALDGFRWGRLEPLRAADDQRARQILDSLRIGLTEEEFSKRVVEILTAAEDDLFAWATAQHASDAASEVRTSDDGPHKRANDVPLEPSPRPSPVVDPHTIRVTHTAGEPIAEIVQELTSFLEAHRDDEVEVTWRVVE